MMFVYFTERPYRGLTEDEIYRHGSFFGIPNDRFDEVRASTDYNYYLDENALAEDLGFDGIALNEHHGNPYCMGGIVDVEAAILARITSRAKIVLIGNALPNRHPLRLAEELATIDLISKGRLVTGWVRGAGFNQFFNNLNPAYNREYFEEAHDFIIQAWTRPGPWRYEGTHFNYRHVNPWVLPFQKPFPPMWIPGVFSPETILWAAQHNYPYVSLGATPALTCDMWDVYADEAARCGYQAGPENFGCVLGVALADTDERAQTLGSSFYFGGGHPVLAPARYQLPAGYNSPAAIKRLSKSPGGSWTTVDRSAFDPKAPPRAAKVDVDRLRRRTADDYSNSQANLKMLVGTPETVVTRAKAFLDVVRPGVVLCAAPQGNSSNEERQRSMRLLAEHVLPELRDYAHSIGLSDPFQRTPGSTQLRSGERRNPVVDRGRLDAPDLQAGGLGQAPSRWA